MSRSPYDSSIRVDEWEVRRIFKEERILERADAGEFRVKITRSKEVLEDKVRDWVPGTLSQELRYYNHENILIAKAHRYLRPDGKLAASGLEDPKRVVKDNIMYIRHVPEGEDEL